MRLKLLDSLSLPGDPGKPNDDALAHGETAALVMDGATGLSEPLMPGRSDAAWLSGFGARRIMAYLGEGASGREAVTAALFDAQTSFEALRKRPPAGRYEIPYAAMTLAVARGAALEILWFGDCAALVRQPGKSVALIGDALAKRAQEASGAARLARAAGTHPVGQTDRPEFMDALRRARDRLNTESGNWAFGPDVLAADRVASREIGAPAGTRLLLASDGFLALACDYRAYDIEGLMAAAQEKGLKALGQELRGIEAGDPLGIAYPRFKMSDDATAVLLELV